VTARWATLAGLGLLAAALALALEAGRSGPAVALAGLAVLALGLAAFERGPNGAKEVALVASYAAAAAAGRVVFAAIPGVQPVTVMTACAGVALGARAGAAVGAVAALVSNGFLGQGPWTPWQMLGWGLVGASAALAGRALRGRLALCAFCVVWGFAYGALLDLWDLAAFGPVFTWPAYLTFELRGLPFDVAHAAGNAVIALAAGPALVRLLDRYGRRLSVEIAWEDEPAAGATRGGGASAGPARP
jgi:energy-coupling factor transport system substrate-specific component